MNIAKLIAKFLKEGLAALSAEEKTLLTENVSLMSPAQKSQFEKAVAAEKKGDEDEDEDDEEADEEAGEGEDEEVDEKALKSMISKSVQDEIASNLESIATKLVDKFVSKAKISRKKALDTGTKETDENREETRAFLKAIVSEDKLALAEMHKKTLAKLGKKATTYNYDDDGARGGYLLPTELMAEVLRIAEKQYGLCRREFRYLPFSGPGNERKIPTLATSVTVYWVNEAAKKGGTNPTFGLVTQTLKKLAAIVPLTEEILEDSAINLTQLVAELFAEAVAKEEDTQFLYGTGSPWTGILNNGSVKVVALATGQGVSSVSFEKLVDMQDECPSGALPGAKYYMNRQIFSYLRKLRADAVSASDGKGMFLLPPTRRDIEDILGYPIEFSDAMPGKTLTGASKPFVIFGNLRLAAIFGDKQQIRATLLKEATITDGDGTTVLNLAEQDMIALRLEERVGYVLAIPTAIVVLKTGAAS